jgi:hypothetical protein
MRPLHILPILAIVSLGVSVSACENLPAEPNDATHVAAFSGNRQSHVTLCHRQSSGGYLTITVADAAYHTHMAHGDREAGPYFECPTVHLSRLELLVQSPSTPWYGVTVTQHAFGDEPLQELGVCFDEGGFGPCVYDVPTGATVTLSSAVNFTYTWDDGIMGATRVIDADRSVLAEDY